MEDLEKVRSDLQIFVEKMDRFANDKKEMAKILDQLPVEIAKKLISEEIGLNRIVEHNLDQDHVGVDGDGWRPLLDKIFEFFQEQKKENK